METKIECPFCGEHFHGFANRAEAEHPPLPLECPLFGRVLRIEQWAMRPPRKEQPSMPVVESEVNWLRGLVEKLVIQEPAQEITYNVMPGEQNKG